MHLWTTPVSCEQWQTWSLTYIRCTISGCCLIRSSGDLNIREFSVVTFKLLFTHKYTESIYRLDILDNLIGFAGANHKKTVNTVLKTLTSLLENKNQLKQHTISLMRLLEILDSLELKHVKQVFEILCSLTCGSDADESMSGMRDEIHMIIRKQLHSTKRIIKHRYVTFIIFYIGSFKKN